jgi:hypothetical protein
MDFEALTTIAKVPGNVGPTRVDSWTQPVGPVQRIAQVFQGDHPTIVRLAWVCTPGQVMSTRIQEPQWCHRVFPLGYPRRCAQGGDRPMGPPRVTGKRWHLAD